MVLDHNKLWVTSGCQRSLAGLHVQWYNYFCSKWSCFNLQLKVKACYISLSAFWIQGKCWSSIFFSVINCSSHKFLFRRQNPYMICCLIIHAAVKEITCIMRISSVFCYSMYSQYNIKSGGGTTWRNHNLHKETTVPIYYWAFIKGIDQIVCAYMNVD